MGCFLHCFGSSKHTKQRRNAHHHHHVRNASGKPEQPRVSSLQETVLSTDSQVQAKPQEQLNASPRKKVTFDSNVRTYEPVLLADFQPEKSEDLVKKSSQSSEGSSVTSTGSYPTNHRYHNCPHSDDEDGEVDYWDSDLTDEEDDGDSVMGGEEEYDDEVGEDTEDGDNQVPIPMCDEDVKSIELKNPNARDRSVYVHPVLNPVENLTQWKAVKAKKAPPLMSQKENLILNQQESPKKLNKDIAVDASLSNWLASLESTINKDLYERSSSLGSSNSVISHEDGPILGALTVQEIKQFSTSSSPRKSPIRGVNEMPIIGSVGSYSNSGGYAEDSGSATSFKGVTHGASSRRVYT